MSRLNTVVMVPKGAEFKAVKNGLNTASSEAQDRDLPQLVSLPVGPDPVKAFLGQWCQESRGILPQTRVVLMGLCGSLTPRLEVTDAVIYERCINGVSGQAERTLHCRNDLIVGSPKNSFLSVIPVTGVMCDRVISSAVEKQEIGATFQADVVDMEGFAALEILLDQVAEVSMLRVVSDDAAYDLPDLSGAFDPDGNINPWVMTRQFILRPLGALRLIQGSLLALKQLEKLAYGVALQCYREP